MRDHVFKHSQYSPSDQVLYIDFIGVRSLFLHYKKELDGFPHMTYDTFGRVWNRVLCEGIEDPETSAHYVVNVRKSRAKGFAHCNVCEYYKHKIAGTRNVTKKAAYQRKLHHHILDVLDDRKELARVIRQCITNPKHSGFYIDAADSCKFQVPTTSAKGKNMSELWRIRQKLTCIQEFDLNKSLHFFRTLPDVPTGANLTMTIVTKFLALKDFAKIVDLHINVDGAGDNINYTLLYSMVHLLLSAKTKGWALKRIHLLRMKVGHTHCDIDATFALLSKDVYGKHSRGDSRKNIFSLSGFKKVTRTHTRTHVHTHTIVCARHTHTLTCGRTYTHTHTHT